MGYHPGTRCGQSAPNVARISEALYPEGVHEVEIFSFSCVGLSHFSQQFEALKVEQKEDYLYGLGSVHELKPIPPAPNIEEYRSYHMTVNQLNSLKFPDVEDEC